MPKITTVTLAALCLVGSLQALSADKPLATTDGEFPGVSLQVLELKIVSGGTVMLRFTVKNDADKAFPTAWALRNGGGSAVDGLYLVDLAGKKKYLPVYDSSSKCLCSDNVQDVGPKSSANFWVKFSAPSDTVQKIGIVAPHFAPMDDVPLSR